jgi:membrane protease YdiL (CAAX protease family)
VGREAWCAEASGVGWNHHGFDDGQANSPLQATAAFAAVDSAARTRPGLSGRAFGSQDTDMQALTQIIVVIAPLAVASIIVWRHYEDSFLAGMVIGLPATVLSVALATWALHSNGSDWSTVGLYRLERPWFFVLWCLGAILVASASIAVAQAIGSDSSATESPGIDRFAGVQGSIHRTTGAIVGVWIVSALGEELIFRGYVLNVLVEVLPGGIFGLVAAVVLSSAVFGVTHIHRGRRAVVASTAAGVAYAIVYLVSGKLLWATIVAHGTIDSVAVLAAIHGGSRGAA